MQDSRTGTIGIAANQTVIVYSSVGPQPNLTITAAPGNPAQFNYWGVRPSQSNTPLVIEECSKSVGQQFSWNSTSGELESSLYV